MSIHRMSDGVFEVRWREGGRNKSLWVHGSYELARKVGLEQRFKKKDDVLKAVRQKILSVKGTWDRKDA